MYTISGNSKTEMNYKHAKIIEKLKVIGEKGENLTKYDYLSPIKW